MRKWRIHIIRKKAQLLGTVEAPDADAAIKAAIKTFDVPVRDQRRLTAQPLEGRDAAAFSGDCDGCCAGACPRRAPA